MNVNKRLCFDDGNSQCTPYKTTSKQTNVKYYRREYLILSVDDGPILYDGVYFSETYVRKFDVTLTRNEDAIYYIDLKSTEHLNLKNRDAKEKEIS